MKHTNEASPSSLQEESVVGNPIQFKWPSDPLPLHPYLLTKLPGNNPLSSTQVSIYGMWQGGLAPTLSLTPQVLVTRGAAVANTGHSYRKTWPLACSIPPL
jgi:hypothetical protein